MLCTLHRCKIRWCNEFNTVLKLCINLAEILSMHIPLPWTESLAMPETVPVRGRVQTLECIWTHAWILGLGQEKKKREGVRGYCLHLMVQGSTSSLTGIGSRRRVAWIFQPAAFRSVMTGRKEGNVLFNDVLNTFYLWLYGIRHMVKDHWDSERRPTATTWATLSD